MLSDPFILCVYVRCDSLRGGQGLLQKVGVLHGLLRCDSTDGIHGQQLLQL